MSWRCLRLVGAHRIIYVLEKAGVDLEHCALQLQAQLLTCLTGDDAMFGDSACKSGDICPEVVLIDVYIIFPLTFSEIACRLADVAGLGALVFSDGDLLRLMWLLLYLSALSQFRIAIGLLFWRSVLILDYMSRLSLIFFLIILFLELLRFRVALRSISLLRLLSGMMVIWHQWNFISHLNRFLCLDQVRDFIFVPLEIP